MSSVIWDGDNLIQKVGGNVEELGHVKYDDNSKDYILWLKDTYEVTPSRRWRMPSRTQLPPRPLHFLTTCGWSACETTEKLATSNLTDPKRMPKEVSH